MVKILILLVRLTRFYGLRVNRVLSLYIGDKANYGLLYSIKCYLKYIGLKAPFIIYGVIFCIVPFILIAVQRKYRAGNSKTSQTDAILESIYDIVIAMTTVGFGEIKH